MPAKYRRGHARVHVRIHEKRNAVHATTRMAAERDPLQIPQILFPDNETFVASDVDFGALFPTPLPRFTTVKRFACTRCQLAQVPTALYDLATLTEVTLVGNAIGAVPVQFQGWGIVTLDLAKNKFTNVPIEVWAMPQLGTLNLSGNRITTCASPAISSSSKVSVNKLRSLTLDDNLIALFTCRFPTLETLCANQSLHNTSLTTLPRILKDLPTLRRLDVGGNPSLVLPSTETLSLATLEDLDLSSNGLQRLPSVLRTLTPNVKTLWLAHNSISDQETALVAASTLPDLATLVLDGNTVANATAVLARFPTLTNLSLTANGITYLSSPTAFESLRFLNVSTNAITSFNVSLPLLEILDLSNNSLAVVSTAIFALRNLQSLDLSGNPIEPWELTPEQFTFLSTLRTLRIDQTAFASCAIDRQRELQRVFKVCVSSSLSTSPVQPTPSAKPSSANGTSSRASSTDQLLYLGGSFLIAILIALWIYTVRRRRARAAEAVSSSASHASAAASPSPIQRVSSMVRSPPRPMMGSVSRTYERTSRASETRSPLAAQPLVRETSTFWEDEELQAWRVEFTGVHTQARIAVGVFSEVWRASYRTDTVAVKKLKTSLRLLHAHHPETLGAGVLDDLIFEIRVLSRLDHPRIVAFFGAAWTSESELTAIMEFLPQQDLRGLLAQRASSPSSSSWSVAIVHTALCVAEALVYLHAQEPPLIHGNVQAANVLLTDPMDAKLCDFGSAQYCTAIPLLSFSDHAAATSESEGGDNGGASSSLSLASVRADATPWIAPEVLRSQAVCDPSIDMYAFGVLLAEIDTNAVPYTAGDAAQLNDLEIRHHVAVGMLRPAFTRACPLSVLALASRCLAFEPRDRPTSTDVAFALREMLGVLTANNDETSNDSPHETSRSTMMGPLYHLPSHDSDGDMSQRTIEFRRYSSA